MDNIASQIVKRGMRKIVFQSKKKGDDNNQENKGRATKEYSRMSSGFQCFLCCATFTTNEERIQHLEKEPHGGMYDTGSPQEREDSRRCRSTSS
jgi:hypothetical protein